MITEDTLIHNPKNTFFIEEMFAFCSVDEEGEGVVAIPGPMGRPMPLMGADMTRVDSIRPIAQEVSDALGIKIILKKFSTVEVLEELCPKK